MMASEVSSYKLRYSPITNFSKVPAQKMHKMEFDVGGSKQTISIPLQINLANVLLYFNLF